MDRTGYVIKTPKGETNKNKLRLPEFGVVFLQLKAGKNASVANVPTGAKAGGEKGVDTFHFVPEHETIELHYQVNNPTAVVKGGKLELFTRFDSTALWSVDLETAGETWIKHGKHVVKWDGRIPDVKAKIEGTYDKGTKTWSHDLTKFAVDKSKAAFPDGFVTLEHTPYKLKLTLTSAEAEIKGKPTTGWTYFHILVKSIELALGPEETVPATAVDDSRHKADKALRKKMVSDGGLPGDAATRKITLISDVYKTSLAEMDNNTAFTQYQSAWGDGPNIPIVAKIRLLDSADAEVKIDETPKGAVALGKAKFLWEWEDPNEDIDGVQTNAKVKTFIKDATNYFKDGTDATRAAKNHTYPKGDNCHVDHGGKRGPDAKPVFPNHAGYAPKDTLDTGKFPFKVVAGASGPKKRKWASFSEGWTSGKLKGHTGAVFQPSRMAGDNYKLSVYLAYDKAKKDELVLDAITEPLAAPAAIKKSTGTFQIWREIHIARYIRKTASLAKFMPGNLAAVRAHFNRAYVELVDNMGGDNNNYVMADHRFAGGATPNYNTLLRARLTGTGNVLFTSNLATDPAADHSSVDSMVRVRTYADFVRRVHANLHSGVAAAANDFTGAPAVTPQGLGTISIAGWPTNAKTARLKATRTWLRTNGVETEAKYCNPVLDNALFGVGEPLANDLKFISGSKSGVGTKAPEGVTTIEFNYTNTALRDFIAAGNASAYWYGAAIDPTDADRNRCAIMFWLAGVDEFSHEFGHHVFLPHAKYPLANQPGGFKVNRHDDTDSGCLMSYSASRHGFCGLCQLRMRGWSATKLDKDTAKNKKP